MQESRTCPKCAVKKIHFEFFAKFVRYWIQFILFHATKFNHIVYKVGSGASGFNFKEINTLHRAEASLYPADMKNRIYLQILEKRVESADTASLVLQPLNGFFSYKPGQFLTLLLSLEGQEIRRSYSFSSSPGVDPYPIITVKRQPNGIASSYLVEKAEPGEVLTALPPAGQFVLPVSWRQPHHLFMIAGGSGISPIFSLLKYTLACTTRFRVMLVYASRDEQNLIFKEELKKWLDLYPSRFKAIFLLSTPKGGLEELNGSAQLKAIHGRLGNSLLEEIVKDNKPPDESVTDFFLCGPPGLLLKSEMTLRFMGYPKENVHKEVFTITPPFRPPAERLPDGAVALSRNGSVESFPIRAGQTILEAAEQAEIELPFSCRSGICTTCTAICQEGEVEMYLPDGPLSSSSTKGVIQTCVGYPVTTFTKITVG